MRPADFSKEFDEIHRKAIGNYQRVPLKSRYRPLVSRLICMELEAASWPDVKRYLTNFKRFTS